jgi:hypothetical protein
MDSNKLLFSKYRQAMEQLQRAQDIAFQYGAELEVALEKIKELEEVPDPLPIEETKAQGAG